MDAYIGNHIIMCECGGVYHIIFGGGGCSEIKLINTGLSLDRFSV